MLLFRYGLQENYLKEKRLDKREERISTLRQEYDDFKTENESFLDYLQFRDMNIVSSFNKSVWSTISKAKDRTFIQMLREDFFQPIFTNPITVFSQKSPLAVIIFAIIVGIACIAVQESSELFLSFLGNINEIIEKITEKIILLSPIPIFFLSLEMVLSQGLAPVSSMLQFILAFVVAVVLHLLFFIALIKIKGAGSFLKILKK